jgi:ABC-type bacteriocin/lantibiotic exporter with double-glycine peptidase domain
VVDVREPQEIERTDSAVGREPSRLALDVALYTVVRIGMLVVVAGGLMLCTVPLLAALAVSVVVVMPLSMLVFGRLRRRVAVGLAERSAARSAQREQLRAQLRGERDADSGAAS